MPCTRPLKGWYKEDGGFSISGGKGAYPKQHMSVPCGQCMGCRIAKTNTWATRIMHEAQMHEISAFITLTYDEENFPERGSINKEHLQLFIKRLRKYIQPQKIRYYACGEYGDTFQRPHYHLIIFNYWPEDAKIIKETNYGNLFSSEKLNQIWKKGYVGIGGVAYESAAYTAKYITKKITGTEAHDHYFHRVPEFSLMSTRPGIGYDWFKKYHSQTLELKTVISRGRERSIPTFYKRKLKEESVKDAFMLNFGRERSKETEKDLERMDKFLNEKHKYFTGLQKN